MITPQSINQLRGADLATVRRHVRDGLESTPSFRALDPSERRDIAQSMVNVLSYLSHPSGGDPRLSDAARRQLRAQGLADDPRISNTRQQQMQGTQARDALQNRLAQAPGQVGNEMQGNVVGQAGTVAGNLVKQVDFPKFVSSLIEGVFTSIVNSSIKQMHEFGKFLSAVAMTVKDFAAENVHPDEAREHLAARHPGALETEERGGRTRLRRKPGASDEMMPDFGSMFGFGAEDDVDLDDDEGEAKIVEGAQLQLARLRQTQLATMVLMGINRIVVTEGEIKATVTFDVSTSESAGREATATMDDRQSHVDAASKHEYESKRNFWGTERSGKGSSSSEVNTRISSAASAIEDTSEARMEAKAKMTGFVQVKFKSETFPLERLASATEFQAVQERAAK